LWGLVVAASTHDRLAGEGRIEGIWSLRRRGWLSNVAFSTPEHLVQRIRPGLRHIQYRSELMDGCLAETGLTIRVT
jgi:hypothetical protein